MAARSIKNAALSYLMAADAVKYKATCLAQFEESGNMTDVSAALRFLEGAEGVEAEAQGALAAFYKRWQSESLVVNAWLQIQAASERPGALQRVRQLMNHEAFEITNPNKVRSVIGAFCNQNPAQFHAQNGEGYVFLADQVIALNTLNPQIASRLLTPLTRWKKQDAQRAAKMIQELKRIKSEPLSPDVFEVIEKSLADA